MRNINSSQQCELSQLGLADPPVHRRVPWAPRPGVWLGVLRHVRGTPWECEAECLATDSQSRGYVRHNFRPQLQLPEDTFKQHARLTLIPGSAFSVSLSHPNVSAAV